MNHLINKLIKYLNIMLKVKIIHLKRVIKQVKVHLILEMN